MGSSVFVTQPEPEGDESRMLGIEFATGKAGFPYGCLTGSEATSEELPREHSANRRSCKPSS